jgi:hypothetical protein
MTILWKELHSFDSILLGQVYSFMLIVALAYSSTYITILENNLRPESMKPVWAKKQKNSIRSQQ